MKLSTVLQCSVDWILFGEQRFTKSLNDENIDSHICTLSSLESELISLYSELLPEDQEEILDFIKIKIKRKGRQGNLSNSGDTSTSEIA